MLVEAFSAHGEPRLRDRDGVRKPGAPRLAAATSLPTHHHVDLATTIERARPCRAATAEYSMALSCKCVSDAHAAARTCAGGGSAGGGCAVVAFRQGPHERCVELCEQQALFVRERSPHQRDALAGVPACAPSCPAPAARRTAPAVGGLSAAAHSATQPRAHLAIHTAGGHHHRARLHANATACANAHECHVRGARIRQQLGQLVQQHGQRGHANAMADADGRPHLQPIG